VEGKVHTKRGYRTEGRSYVSCVTLDATGNWLVSSNHGDLSSFLIFPILLLHSWVLVVLSLFIVFREKINNDQLISALIGQICGGGGKIGLRMFHLGTAMESVQFASSIAPQTLLLRNNNVSNIFFICSILLFSRLSFVRQLAVE
jgi:hypothetical protein